MPAERRVYLTPEEAASGATRMIRPVGGDWVEIHIPPTRHGTVLRVAAGDAEVRIRVMVVALGLTAPPVSTGPGGWRASLRIGLVLAGLLVAVIVALVVIRGCAAGGTAAVSAVVGV